MRENKTLNLHKVIGDGIIEAVPIGVLEPFKLSVSAECKKFSSTPFSNSVVPEEVHQI